MIVEEKEIKVKRYAARFSFNLMFRFSIDVHGLDSVFLVPSYIILCEASIGEYDGLSRWFSFLALLLLFLRE